MMKTVTATITAPTERAINFNGEMVRAILNGRKTQTRRPVKPQPETLFKDSFGRFLKGTDQGTLSSFTGYIDCPYGRVGDRLWVRETWLEDRPTGLPEKVHGALHYQANGYTIQDIVDSWAGHWKRDIHMPRWASRITLEITDVRVERLQSISENDAEAEGVDVRYPKEARDICRLHFHALWNNIYGLKPSISWDANPWVWVVEFKRIEA